MSFRMGTVCVWLLLGAAVLAVCTSVHGAQDPVRNDEFFAIGRSVVSGGNVAEARKAALSDAILKGMEDFLVRAVGVEAVAARFPRFLEDFLPGAREQIETYNLVAEHQTETHYTAFVRVRVNENLLMAKLKDMGILEAERIPITILFMVSEHDRERATCWWQDPYAPSALSPTELAIHNAFQSRGFSPINRTQGVPETDLDERMRSAELSDALVRRWGTLFSADVVLFGRTEILPHKEVALTLKACAVKEGAFVSGGSESRRIEGVGEGTESILGVLGQLAESAAARMAPAIVEHATPVEERIQKLTVELRGVTSYREFGLFRTFLKQRIAGVRSVTQKRIRKNSIRMEVEIQGDTTNFVTNVLDSEDLPFMLQSEEAEEGILVFVLQ